MKDLAVFITFLAFGIGGFFVMGRLDKFLEEMHQGKYEAKEKAAYVSRQTNCKDGESRGEIHVLCRRHSCAYAVLFDLCQSGMMRYADLYSLKG